MTECSICLQEKKILIQLCPRCKCYCGKKCLDKYVNYNGSKCMICKAKIPRLKYFFAGKIEPKDTDNQGSEFSQPDSTTRICVINKDYWNSHESMIDNLSSEKSASWEEVETIDFVNLKDYINIELKLPNIMQPKYIITGPACIIDAECVNNIQHGCWIDKYLLSSKELIPILNIRNDEMIDACDVFSLEIDDKFSCYRSITEWGIAKEKGKKLLIYFNSKKKHKCAEFYTHIQDCLFSIGELDERMKELIIFCHPKLNKLFSGFEEYKSYLEDIINFKNKEK